MITVVSLDDENSCSSSPNKTDLLIENNRESHQSLLNCNADLAQCYNVLKASPTKGKYFRKILSKNGMKFHSLPTDLDEQKKLINNSADVSESCNVQLYDEHVSPPQSPSHDLWFNTWPERYEKLATSPDKVNMTNGNLQKLTLSEALKSISLAYSPVTKQLHFMQQEEESNDPKVTSSSETQKLGHKRNEPGSFSSTISSLSDASPSGSLLDSDDRSSPVNSETGTKPKKSSLSNFLNKNVFSWKAPILTPTTPKSIWKLFSKSTIDNQISNSPQHENVIASSTALIQLMRPSNLPAKTEEEERRHRVEYKEMLAAAKRKEALNSAAKQRQHKLQLKLEEQQAISAKHFLNTVLHNWDTMCNTRKTRELWWLGLPPSIRGKVWCLAIGNDLNLTPQLYEICVSRAQTRLNNSESLKSVSDLDQESSMDVIQLDISRTFPNLCIFQEGGPYSEVLHSLLAAYVCYRPDVGYVQGMSYIAAILILNMEPADAFICFANLLNRPLHIATFTLNQVQMQAYFSAYNEIFNYNLPKLYVHFEKSNLTPDLYLLDWIYTIYAKAMPLDIACRVWDIYLRDGDEFLFRTALGILHMSQDMLMQMDFLHGSQFLTRLPDDLPVDQLFKSIQIVSTNIGKSTFNQIVEKYCANNIADL